MSYVLPPLPYAYDALEPYIDAQTMEIHYTKHHQTYLNNVNMVLENLSNELAQLPVEKLISQLEKVPVNQQTVIRNNAGGHANHSFFWKSLKRNTTPQGNLKMAIDRHFGSFDTFKKEFEKAAMTHFGSGWIWLILNEEGNLSIVSTINQDSPLMGKVISGVHGYPILGLDIWEHAYYLKYQNRRLDYVNAFWNVINWDEAEVCFSSKK